MWTDRESPGRYDRSRLALSERSDGRGMGACWSRSLRRPKRGGNRRHVVVREVVQRPDVYPEHRVSLAGDRQGPAAALDALRLFRPMGLGRHARSHPRRALCAVHAQAASREASPTAAIIDSQSVKKRGKKGACD